MNTIQLAPRDSIGRPNTPAISRSRTAATRQRIQRRGDSVAAQKRILVVDDHRHSREGLRESLLGEGYQVEELKVAKVLEKPIDPTQLKAIVRTLNL